MADYSAASSEGEVTERSAGPWQECIQDAKKYFAFWNEKSDGIEKLYADLKKLADATGDREFQMFWANQEILKATVYSRPPAPAVEPRFKDMKPLPRTSSEVLERTLVVNFDLEDINAVMLQVRDDMLTNGRGAGWVRYEDDSDPVEGEAAPSSNVPVEPQNQRVPYEHLDRADFLHEPARKWQEVGWVAKRAWLTRDQGLRRFGDIFAKVDLKERKDQPNSSEATEYKTEKKGEVWEIWSKTRDCVVWITEGLEEVLDIRSPFLKLEGFFPCPRPAYATTECRKLIPVPDYLYYKDQLDEINELTACISALAEYLRMKGFYAGGAGEIGEAIEIALKQQDNNAVLIPIANMASLGGLSLKDSVIWLPVTEVAATIKELIMLRRQLIEDVYQITGLSDIMRGATDPNETLGAQELKSQYGNIRIKERQAELVRFARDLTRIAGEIMAENFTPQTFADMAQMDLPTQAAIQRQLDQIIQAAQDPQMQAMAQQNPEQGAQLKQQAEQKVKELQDTVTIEKVVGLLRQQRIRPFVLDIETDSTIQVDENTEKQRRTEFLGALAGTIQQLTPLVQAQPAAGPFAAEMIKFAVAPFRAGRSMTAVIEEFTETIRKQAQQAAENPQPSPDQIKAEGEKQRLALDEKKHSEDIQLRREEIQLQNEREIRKDRVAGDLAGNEAGQPAAYSMAQVIEGLARQNASVLQALQMIAQVLAAPKTVTTPEGRTYTTQPSPQGMN